MYPFKDTIRGVATNNWNWLWSGLWDRGSSYSCCPEGKRDAIIDATSYLKPGIIRFAGGLWANGVGWDRNGVTSSDDGAWTYTDPQTGQKYSYNHVYKPAMVDSFQDFRSQLDAEAIIQVNICDNNPKMWADLVRYSNIEKKYGFEYWELGNEQTLDSCGLNATTYAQRYAQYQAALKAVDPSIKIMGPIDHQPYYTSWEDALVNQMGDDLDVLAWHWYQISEWTTNTSSFAYQGGSIDALLAWGGSVGSCQDGFGCPGDPNSIADGNLNRWTYRRGIAEQKMDYVNTNFRSSDPTLETAITEFGVHASAHTSPINGNHIAAIWLADMLPRWAYNGLDIITYYSLEDGSTSAGNSRGLVGSEGSSALDIRPTYDTEWLYAQHFGDMMVQSSTSDPEQKVVIWASKDSDDGKLKLMLVNLSGDNANAQVKINGFSPSSTGAAYVMSSTNPLSMSDPDSFTNHNTTINGVKIPDYQINNPSVFDNAINSIKPVNVPVSSNFNYTVPAYAVVALELSSSGGSSNPAPTATATKAPAAPTATAVPTKTPATATPVPSQQNPPATVGPVTQQESGNWPAKVDLKVGESSTFKLENGQTRTVTLVDYDIVIPRQKVLATVRVDGGGKSSTTTVQVAHAGVPVAVNGVWVFGYAWKEANDNGFEDVGRQGGFPLTSGKDVGFALNDAAYPFYPNLDDYTYPINGGVFNEGAYIQTFLDPDGWAHSGFDIGARNNQGIAAITDGYVWYQYYGGQGMLWITKTNDQWDQSQACWVFTHIKDGSMLVSNGAFVKKGTPLTSAIFGDPPSIHAHMGSCNTFDYGSWLFAASIWNNEHQTDYPAPRYWLGLGAYSGDLNTNRIASNESGDLSASFAPKAGDRDLNGSEQWRVVDNFVNSVVRVGEVLSDAPFSGYSDRTGSNSVGYLATYIYSPVDYTSSTAVHLKFGASRGARVWLNGDKVHDATESRYNSFNTATEPTLVIDKYDYVMPLKQGWNLLVIKTDNGDRSGTLWAVSPKIGNSAGKAISGLVFSTRDTELTVTGGSNSISASWNAISSTGSFVDSYLVDVASDAAFQNIVKTVDAGKSTSTTITGLPGGHTYYVRLRPYNASAFGGSTNWQDIDEASAQVGGQGGSLPATQPTATPTQRPSQPTATPTQAPPVKQTPTAIPPVSQQQPSDGPDDVPPSQSPPDGLAPSQAPQFIALGSDDNWMPEGVNWFVDKLMAGRTNPAGTGNPATFDGTPALMSFYLIGLHETYGKELCEAHRAAYDAGHEIGNHGYYGVIGDAPHSSVSDWLNNWIEPTNGYLTRPLNCNSSKNGLGIPASDIYGFRTPQDAFNANLWTALEQAGFTYANSTATGWGSDFDGTDLYWPGTLEQPFPLPSWAPQTATAPGFWEVPQNWMKMPVSLQGKYGSQIGYCDKDWFDAGMTGAEIATMLKYNLDLHMQGNRAPLNLCLHSQEWGTPAWENGGVDSPSLIERRQGLTDFMDYALSKQDARVVRQIDVINWMRNPVALGSASQPGATATPPASTPTTAPTQAPASTPQLVYSVDANRTGAATLNGKTVSGNVYVWVSPDSQVTSAAFYLDDPAMNGSPERLEMLPAFDLMGTAGDGTGLPLDTTTLSDGAHSVTVRLTLSSGPAVVTTATFNIGNQPGQPTATPTTKPTQTPTATSSPQPTATSTPSSTPTVAPTTTPPVSSAPEEQGYSEYSASPDRTNPADLDGATVSGQVYVWVSPESEIERVSFFLDDQKMNGTALRIENVAPFDLTGTSWTGAANPFDTATLSNGIHTLTIQVTLSDGSSYTSQATFRVSNGGGATNGAPTPTATPSQSPTATAQPQSSNSTIDRRIATGADDAMEAPGGWPEFDSTSQEIYAGSANGGGTVWDGWRWSGLNIPAGAKITVAYVELVNADATWNIATGLSLEDSADPSTFSESNSPYDRWQDDRTDFETSWRWRQNQSGSAYRTPSLVSGVQELVDRYNGINGLVLLESGEGNREGRYHSWSAFEDSPGRSAKLHIEYQMP